MIRALVLADRDAILELFAKLGAEHLGWSQRIGQSWFEDELKSGRGLGLFEPALSAMLFYRTQPDFSEITFLMADPGRSGQGLMSQLWSHYLIEIKGVNKVFLEVHAANLGAIGFYRGKGFGEIGRRPGYYPDGGEAICLELTNPCAN